MNTTHVVPFQKVENVIEIIFPHFYSWRNYVRQVKELPPYPSSEEIFFLPATTGRIGFSDDLVHLLSYEGEFEFDDGSTSKKRTFSYEYFLDNVDQYRDFLDEIADNVI